MIRNLTNIFLGAAIFVGCVSLPLDTSSDKEDESSSNNTIENACESYYTELIECAEEQGSTYSVAAEEVADLCQLTPDCFDDYFSCVINAHDGVYCANGADLQNLSERLADCSAPDPAVCSVSEDTNVDQTDSATDTETTSTTTDSSTETTTDTATETNTDTETTDTSTSTTGDCTSEPDFSTCANCFADQYPTGAQDYSMAVIDNCYCGNECGVECVDYCSNGANPTPSCEACFNNVASAASSECITGFQTDCGASSDCITFANALQNCPQ